jgi:hypothetical protein
VKQVPCGNGKKEKQMQQQSKAKADSPLRYGMTKMGAVE